ncbi:MAG TPA: CrpP-related protein [Burkholderiaceae bacterium]|nr:CrpP-related protein [Burkholderiaceae bacterium]
MTSPRHVTEQAHLKLDQTIVRDGACVAASGDSSKSNPYLLPENMPGITGEPFGQWARKHDDWMNGFEDERRRIGDPSGPKIGMPAAVLCALVTRRFRRVPAICLELDNDPRASLCVQRPARHERDAQGRNWDIAEFRCGAAEVQRHAPTFRSIVDHLRDQYDLS